MADLTYYSRELLTAEGIESTIADDDNSLKALWVSETDYLAAEDFVRRLSKLPSNEPPPQPQRVASSSTGSTPQSFKDDDDEDYPTTPPPQPEPVDTTSTRRIWIGLLAVTIIFLPRYSPLTLLYNLVVSRLHVRTFYEEIALHILYQWIGAACVLLIIWWDGAPLGVFGIKRPAWSMDTVTACIAFAAHQTLGFMAVDLFVDFLHTLNYKIPISLPLFRISCPEAQFDGRLPVTCSFRQHRPQRRARDARIPYSPLRATSKVEALGNLDQLRILRLLALAAWHHLRVECILGRHNLRNCVRLDTSPLAERIYPRRL